ncbi:hypothetical protein [Chitinophaga pinensis]|uniref:DoxX family protein n=1 Tax=Chitinophaga pinensis (strain ATCC 43595 / DSM 2588 / LMG 13176 / NBRC 15968 / NCIMB 11800 / UQM 2034) TaxID=485918 RepID=A0A979FZ67_CHIPD|nr:hypothetical protein [Chitinophaga pinensis]ACU57835.1 hypothetical protein Cpin_0336 [Chitinophaga pinensis DSM 2588]
MSDIIHLTVAAPATPVAEVHTEATTSAAKPWKTWQRVAFRIAFIFFVLMSIPTSWNWYQHLFTMDWIHLKYRDVYDIARFQPNLWNVESESGRWGIASYASWLAALIIAIAGAGIWSIFDRRKEYNILYYWLRVIVRYRAGIGIIGFGYTKLFPVQMPYPSISNLHTNFGDFTAQKIYWLSIGIVPWYQVFAGIVEVLAGVLLFFRGTAAIGAVLLAGALANITFVNFAYDGGVHVYSAYFVILALFVLAYDVPKIYNLLVLERYTIPVHYYPSFKEKWQQYSRYILKGGAVLLFVVILFYLQMWNYLYDPYKQPVSKGIAGTKGYYNVTEFRLNNQVIPYSPQDTVRWQNVTFEKWSTITYQVNKPVWLDLSNGGGSPKNDVDRNFELAGVAGRRRFFYYEADTARQELALRDKNRSQANQGRERQRRNATDRPNTSKKKDPPYVLHYERPSDTRIILYGLNENKDSIYVILDRVDKQYLLSPSKLEAGQY